jgi:hypothetical protein
LWKCSRVVVLRYAPSISRSKTPAAIITFSAS